MATLAQLKTRVILETNKDDMGASAENEQGLIDAYTRAIEYYADELFWFNRKSGTTTTSNGVATATLPSGMRIPQQVSYSQSPLQKVDLHDIEYLTDAGVPTHWAENEGAIQLWPIPNGAYTLSVQGIADLGVPITTNEWTTEAYDLIVAETKLRLYRGTYRDIEGAQLAAGERDEALSKLRRETRRRGAVGLRSDVPSSCSSFNIFRG